MNILARKEEIKILESIYSSEKPEFLAIYGRRRVGKTFLVREFFASKNCVFIDVTGKKSAKTSEQLDIFCSAFEKAFQIEERIERPTDWQQAFRLVEDKLERYPDKKIILFLDEIPWLASRGSKLLSHLDHAWNTSLGKYPGCKLLICGSAASWIIENVISDKGGLHNRITKRIQLDPFSLTETKEFLEGNSFQYSNQQIADIYMVFGGIPFYLQQLDPAFSPIQNINMLCFEKNGNLRGEFEILFSSLFDSSEIHSGIVSHLSSSRKGCSRIEIKKKFQEASGKTLTKTLSELETAGFIKKYIPHQSKVRGTYYRLIDEFCLFYKHWIEPAKRENLEIPKNYWIQQANSQKYRSWSGYTFESLCQKHAQSILSALQIAGMLVKVSTWATFSSDSKEGAQIDLVLDRADKIINLCEVKFTAEPFEVTKAYAKKLRAAQGLFLSKTKTRKAINWVLISANGVKPNSYSQELFTSVLGLDDLFL